MEESNTAPEVNGQGVKKDIEWRSYCCCCFNHLRDIVVDSEGIVPLYILDAVHLRGFVHREMQVLVTSSVHHSPFPGVTLGAWDK